MTVGRQPSFARVLAAVCSVTTAGVLPVFLLGGLAVQISDDLDLSTAALGQAIFGFFIVSALSSAHSGRLTERFGSTHSMRAAGVLGSISAMGVAIAGQVGTLAAALCVGGLANALAQPAANAMVVRTVVSHRQGLALGVKQSAIPMATLLAGLAVPEFALTVGWRWAYVLASLVSLIAASAVPTLGRPIPRDRDQDAQQPFRVAPLAVLGFGVFLGSAMANSLGAFMTSSTVAAGVEPATAGWLLALGSGLGLTLRIASGWLADRRSEHLPTVSLMLGGGAVGLAALSTGEPRFMVLGVLIAFGSGWSWPGVFNLAVVSSYRSEPARATGLTQIGAYVGGATGPLVMGLLVDGFGYRPAWLTFTVVACLAAVVMLVGRRLLSAEPSQVINPVRPGAAR